MCSGANVGKGEVCNNKSRRVILDRDGEGGRLQEKQHRDLELMNQIPFDFTLLIRGLI